MEDRVVKVTARIMGEDYTIRGRTSEEHILLIARFVDEKMLQIAEAYPKLGTSRIAVLAAINLADELLKVREQYEQLTRLLEEEWSQRHGAGGAAERPARATPRPGRLPPAAAPAAGAVPGQTQLSAFGDPETGSGAGLGPGLDVPGRHLYTGDALTAPVRPLPEGEARTARGGGTRPAPGGGPEWESPEDEDQ